MKKCFIFLLFALCFFAWPLSKLHASALVESFEDYTPGTQLQGQGDWIEDYTVGTSSTIISASDSYQGYRSLKIFGEHASDSGRARAMIATTSTLKQCGYFNFDYIAHTGEIVFFFLNKHDDVTSQTEAGLKFENDYIRYWNGNTWTYDASSTMLTTDWHLICIEINNQQMRYYINDYVSSWINNANSINFQADQVHIETSNFWLADELYVDSLSASSTYSNDDIIIVDQDATPDNVEIINPDLFVGDCASEPCVAIINNPKYCFYDLEDTLCTFDFQYNDKVTPANIYLIPPGLFPENMLDSFYMPDDDGGTSHDLIIPNPHEATTSQYNLWVDINGGYRYGTLTVEWANSADIIGTTSEITAMCNCDDIATSTGFFDEFRYGFECGGRKLGCFLFNPSAGATSHLIEAEENFKQNFPISYYYQMKNIFYGFSQATSTTVNLTISGLATSTGMASLNGKELLPLNDLSAHQAEYNLVHSVRQIMVYFIYTILFGYFVFRLLMIAGGKGIFDFFKKQEPQFKNKEL